MGLILLFGIELRVNIFGLELITYRLDKQIKR